MLTTYGYDALNRLTSISYPTSTLDINYYYDEPNSTTGCASSYPIGRLTRMTDSSGSTTYCYDQRGNVIVKMSTIGSVPATTRYSYNLADRLMEVDYPGNQADIVYTRDADGRIASVSNGATPVVTSISYLPFGPATLYSFAGGQTLSKSYDANYRATDITGGNALNLHFKLDALGDITAEGDVAGVPTPNESYQYDPLYRLQGVDDATGAPWQSYTYNKTGDRLSKTTAGQTPADTYSYTPGTHHLIGISGYDASSRAVNPNGNTSAFQANGWTYGLGYNDTNRLSLVQQNGTTTAAYRLDGKGERVRKLLSGATPIEYVYNEAGRLLYEYSGPSQNRSYIWADNTLVATVEDNSTIHYVYTDHLGTPRAVTSTINDTPIWTWPWLQNPFGEQPASGAGGYTFNLRYPGQYYDSETGLSYNYFRDGYEAATGRYAQSDPLGLSGGQVSTYAYVASNPQIHFDPLGLWLFPWEYPVYVEGGSPEEQKRVIDAVNKVFSTCRGQELLNEIKGGWSHGEPRHIVLNDEKWDEAQQPVPGDIIHLDPNWHPYIHTTEGEIRVNLERAIGHELGHAVTGTLDDGPGQMNNVNQNENPIMNELGQPSRTAYEGG